MAAETPEDLADVVVRVALDRQAAQAHSAETVLQFVADLGQQRRGGGEREVAVVEAEQREAGPLHPGQRGVDLLAVDVVEGADPGARPIQILAVPGGAAGQGL
jgi:hypothetical protein